MKKIKLDTAKLQLNKEKIANLTKEELGNINGGVGSCDNLTSNNGTVVCTSPAACPTRVNPIGVPPRPIGG
ncbi:MAG: class I lanthipeptide [Phycisphaerales bacterium]|nr:class I lanthipeptide [Phycisphaerales bacterium]